MAEITSGGTPKQKAPTSGVVSDVTKETGAKPVPDRDKKRFSSISRALNPSELGTKGVQKMLLNHIDRLEEQMINLSECNSKLAVAEKEKAVLEQKLKVAVSADVIFGASLTLGSILLGVCPSLWKNPPFGHLVLVVGVAMVLAGIVSRWLLR